jgi:TatD DNase family protein
MPAFIDSHSHLADPAFDPDREDVIERARSAGARAVVCIGESIDAAGRAKRIADEHPGFIWYSAGVHPHDASQFDRSRDADAIREFVSQRAVAIGECGLDSHYDHSPRELQRRAFAEQLSLGLELNRPVVVHTRDAEDDTRAMITEAGSAGVRGVLHCYTGSHALAEAALAVGWYVSFSGIVTFKKWDDDALIRLIPEDRILVESDAPYLAPVPNRGKRNEPSWVAATVARVANVRGVAVDTFGRQVTDNAARLFALPLSS